MAEILQGTTPALEIKINTEDFLVTDVLKLELTIKNSKTKTIYGLEDVTMNIENNSFIYNFTEIETLALTPNTQLTYQCRFMIGDGIVGTKKMYVNVSDLISEEVMST